MTGSRGDRGREAAWFEETYRAARQYSPDFALAGLLAPATARPGLVALAAFEGDVTRIVETVSEPALAEIRLQWWRDSLAAGIEYGTLSGSPIADAVAETARRYGLGFDGFDRLLDARTVDLYADPVADQEALEAYYRATAGAMFGMAYRVNRGGGDVSLSSETQDLMDPAAASYGRARSLSRAAAVLARGRSPFTGHSPTEEGALSAMVEARAAEATAAFDLVRRCWRRAPAAARAACLPAVLVPAYVAAVTRRGHDPRRMIAEIGPLERVWRLWRGKWFGS